MPMPEPGQALPDFTLTAYNSEASLHLAETAAGAPTLVAFFKQSCATSKMTLPFIERLHRNYPALAVLGVSQDNADETAQFVAQTGASFPVLLDKGWQVSAAYDLFTVPSVFLAEAGGVVRRVNLGWSSEQYEALSADIAAVLGATPAPLLRGTDKVPPFKPG